MIVIEVQFGEIYVCIKLWLVMILWRQDIIGYPFDFIYSIYVFISVEGIFD